MSSASNHQIAPIAEVTRRSMFYFAYNEVKRYTLCDGVEIWTPKCSGKHKTPAGHKTCPLKPEFVSRYCYVTGRAGRVTDRNQYWCRPHAEKWATDHKVPLFELRIISSDTLHLIRLKGGEHFRRTAYGEVAGGGFQVLFDREVLNALGQQFPGLEIDDSIQALIRGFQ